VRSCSLRRSPARPLRAAGIYRAGVTLSCRLPAGSAAVSSGMQRPRRPAEQQNLLFLLILQGIGSGKVLPISKNR